MNPKPLPTGTSKHADYVYAAFISDIHLGHRQTPTAHIIQNLNRAFPDNQATAELDVIFFAGDVFDDALLLTDPNVLLIKQWIYRFLRICKKYNIIVRVLKGTPGHDWNQCKLFTHINDEAKIGVDLRYVTTVEVETIAPLGYSVLYVPDEHRLTTEETWGDVQEALREANTDSVDIGVMHGLFDFQLPQIPAHIAHSTDRYTGIVKRLIVIGHDHTPKQKGKIYVPGSFDNLVHGNEHPKGHLRAKLYKKSSKVHVERVENKTAKWYKTLLIPTTHTLEEAILFLRSQLENAPDQSHFRIKAQEDHPILSSLADLRRQYPQHTLTSDKISTQTKVVYSDLLDTSTFNTVQITQANIEVALHDKLKQRQCDPHRIERAMHLLKQHLYGQETESCSHPSP